MSKVIKKFKCLQEGRKYYPGEVYEGKRKDLEAFLEKKAAAKSKDGSPKTKNKNGKPKTSNK